MKWRTGPLALGGIPIDRLKRSDHIEILSSETIDLKLNVAPAQYKFIDLDCTSEQQLKHVHPQGQAFGLNQVLPPERSTCP